MQLACFAGFSAGLALYWPQRATSRTLGLVRRATTLGSSIEGTVAQGRTNDRKLQQASEPNLDHVTDSTAAIGRKDNAPHPALGIDAVAPTALAPCWPGS